MNKNLNRLIDDYLTDVAYGVSLFKKLTGDKAPLKAWRDNDIPQKGVLSDGIEYELHGIGCLIIYPDYDVDFDFAPNDRIDGFDLWRLSLYLKERVGRYPAYENVDILKKDFEEAIKKGNIAKISHPYCNLYFLAS